jgi:hypothetical protein
VRSLRDKTNLGVVRVVSRENSAGQKGDAVLVAAEAEAVLVEDAEGLMGEVAEALVAEGALVEALRC